MRQGNALGVLGSFTFSAQISVATVSSRRANAISGNRSLRRQSSQGKEGIHNDERDFHDFDAADDDRILWESGRMMMIYNAFIRLGRTLPEKHIGCGCQKLWAANVDLRSVVRRALT